MTDLGAGQVMGEIYGVLRDLSMEWLVRGSFSLLCRPLRGEGEEQERWGEEEGGETGEEGMVATEGKFAEMRVGSRGNGSEENVAKTQRSSSDSMAHLSSPLLGEEHPTNAQIPRLAIKITLYRLQDRHDLGYLIDLALVPSQGSALAAMRLATQILSLLATRVG